ncbi:MAG TPA: cytochrome c oxidase subunit 3 [Kofleriaceae bacterium]|nr:cytochrome c oxidase subunit 3 [Kofleriaceae bacterium]
MSTAHEAHGAEHDLGHHGSPFVQHHYDDAQHQFDSGKLGIWLFLAQEVLFFSALFVQYVLYRVHHGEIYSYAHKWLQVKFGAINTAVLIFSSLTAAWAVRCAQRNEKRGLIACIALTLACAWTFLGIKYVEYSHKVHEHILFGSYFDPCVSPGGAELLTKNNECPGAKSTIEYDYGSEKAKTGCFEQSKLDMNPTEPGVQADCEVSEITREKKAGAKDVEWVEKGRRAITARCPEPHIAEADAPEEKETFPCWRTAYQPAVCPDLTDAEARSHGTGTRPQVGILVEYGDSAERGEEIAIEAKCKAPPAPAAQSIDVLASETGEKNLKLGQGAIHPVHVETAEEEHALESIGPPPEHTGMFFTIYFAMTGLHGIHVLFGVFVFTWLLIRAAKGQFTKDYFGPVDYAALYWHIVDLIWIFLFPLLYLIH